MDEKRTYSIFGFFGTVAVFASAVCAIISPGGVSTLFFVWNIIGFLVSFFVANDADNRRKSMDERERLVIQIPEEVLVSEVFVDEIVGEAKSYERLRILPLPEPKKRC